MTFSKIAYKRQSQQMTRISKKTLADSSTSLLKSHINSNQNTADSIQLTLTESQMILLMKSQKASQMKSLVPMQNFPEENTWILLHLNNHGSSAPNKSEIRLIRNEHAFLSLMISIAYQLLRFISNIINVYQLLYVKFKLK